MTSVAVEMMSSEFTLWRCLHGGPLTRATVDHPKPSRRVPWDRLRARNVALLEKLIQTYGSCAVIAMDGDRIVGQLRFYPKTLRVPSAHGTGLCMQQVFPNGPADDMAARDFPPLDQMSDKTLLVHCLMTGSPSQKDNPYQRKGIGSRMVRTLTDWARKRGWTAIEANAYADLPSLYAVTGQAGKAFWEKLGFRVVEAGVESAFLQDDGSGFVGTLLKEADERGLDPSTARAKYTMRLDLARGETK